MSSLRVSTYFSDAQCLTIKEESSEAVTWHGSSYDKHMRWTAIAFRYIWKLELNYALALVHC